MKFYTLLLSLLVFLSCKNSQENIYATLEKFDASLDSLILVKTYNKPNILVFMGDTLQNNPKKIEEEYFMAIGKDTVKVEANSRIYEFENNEIVKTSNPFGQKIFYKNIYFADKIDNKFLDSLKNIKSDTIYYFGHLNKYDEKGDLIKSVKPSIWESIENGRKIRKEIRNVEIFKYFGKDSVITWRKYYSNEKYDLDSLAEVKISIFRTKRWNYGNHKYTYKKDKFGNWIEKTSKDKNNLEIHYRKYTY